MLENLGVWKARIEAIGFFTILLAGIMLGGVSPFKDDLSKSQCIILATKEQVYQKTLSETFVLAVFISGVAGILYLANAMTEKRVSRIRNVIEVWADLPDYFLAKKNLPKVTDKRFADVWEMPLDERHFLVRYPMHNLGEFRYMAFDMCEDWARYGTTPYRGEVVGNMGVERAKSLLKKQVAPLGRLINQLETVGLSPEETRRKLMEQRLREEAEKKNLPISGPNEEGAA